MTKDEALKLALEALEGDWIEVKARWGKRFVEMPNPLLGDNHIARFDFQPPQRTWVGLTKEEIAEFDTWHDNREEEIGWVNPFEIVAYIEAKLKEKNDG